MPILLAAALVLCVLVLGLLLTPLALVQRYRVGKARRPARRWVATLNAVGATISTVLLLISAAFANAWVSDALLYTIAGLVAGLLLGGLGLALTRWEHTPAGLFLQPSAWLVLLITLAVASRLLYGLWRSWHAWHEVGGDATWLEASGAAGSLAAGAVVLGYLVAYWTGIRWQVGRRLRRTRLPFHERRI